MLLIFPPVAKPSEPPAGIAKLAGALRSCGISCTTLDLNLECMLHVLHQPLTAPDTWTRRAVKGLPANLAMLRDPGTYLSRSRYARAVRDISRVLAVLGRGHDAVLGLADYQHDRWSPVRSADLIAAADQPERNIFYPYFSRRLSEAMNARAESIVGISLNYLSQALCTFAIIGHLRRAHPGVKIVLGGGLVTSWMRRPGWKDVFGGLVDRWIAGQGEGPLLAMHGRSSAAQQHTVPDYGPLPLREYLSPDVILPYSASTGCFWSKCTFCPEPAEGNPYLPVPADVAVEDLFVLTAALRPSLIHLVDNAVSPALMRRLARTPVGVPWYGFARFGPELLDPDHCRALRRSGCVMLKLGLESGDQGVLDRLHKGIDLPMASRILRNLSKADIAAYVYLLFGTPAETAVEARRTLDFVVAHHDAITFLNLAIFNMPLCAGSAWGCETERFYEGDLSLYAAFKHPHGWDRKTVRLFLDREFKKHPAIAEIIRRDPPVFTSNHAAFLVRS